MSFLRSRLARNLGLVVGLGASMLANAAPPSEHYQEDVPVTASGVTATSHVPRRHLSPLTDPITRADYVVPLEGDNSAISLVLANADPNTVTAKIYTDANKKLPLTMTLAPGETKTMMPPAGLMAYVTINGASDVANIISIAQHMHTINGHVVSETVPATAQSIDMGEWSRVPGPTNPGHPSDQGTVAQSVTACTSSLPGSVQLLLLNSAGNLVLNRNGENAIIQPSMDAYSCKTFPDLWTAFNVTPDASMTKSQIVAIPLITGTNVYMTATDNASGDHNTLMAMPKRHAQNQFILPIMRRLTTSVPFAQYTDLSVINPDQSPLQQGFFMAFHARDTAGASTVGNGMQLFAVTHYLWRDAMTNFYTNFSPTQEFLGASPGSNAATMLVWNRIRTAMPHGDVGAMFAVINDRDSCGTANEYQCNLLGLNSDAKIGLKNLSPDPTMVKLETLTEAGVIAGTTQYTLRDRENIEVDPLSQYGLTNARVRLSVVRGNIIGPDVDTFAAWARTPGTDGDEDYQAARQVPAPGTLGDWMVTHYLDSHHTGQVFINNPEAYCMVRGCDDGTVHVDGIASPLANEFVKNPGETWTPQMYIDWMMTATNGITSASDFELYHRWDPFTWSSSGGISFAAVTDQSNSGSVVPGTVTNLTPAATENIYQDVRTFLKSYVNAHQTQYSKFTDPTWSTSSPN